MSDVVKIVLFVVLFVGGCVAYQVGYRQPAEERCRDRGGEPVIDGGTRLEVKCVAKPGEPPSE